MNETFADHVIETGEADYNEYAEKRDQEHESIQAQKQKKKFLFQLISHTDGKRSEPFVQSWDGLTDALLKWKKEDPEQYQEQEVFKNFILLVAVLDDKETQIPATPLITIKTYLETVGKEIHQ